jgi:hypothetical protein
VAIHWQCNVQGLGLANIQSNAHVDAVGGEYTKLVFLLHSPISYSFRVVNSLYFSSSR